MAIFSTKGTCSRQIIFSVEEGILTDLKFIGGCSGSLQAIARLIVGRKVDEIIPILQGIQCRNNTSCPDQLARALAQHMAEK